MNLFGLVFFFEVLGDLARLNPNKFMLFTGTVLWIVCSLISICVVVEQAKKKDCLRVYRSKWMRVVVFFFPLLFWFGMLVYGFVFHIVLDETGDRPSKDGSS